MITENLFQQALINPASEGGGRTLYIVSGYATPAMAFHHLRALEELGLNVSIELIVGMCAREGIRQSHHKGFRQLVENDYPDNFLCSYLTQRPATHSKIYAWFRNEEPVAAFAGSANYTQSAFKGSLREVLVECDPAAGLNYFNSLVDSTIYCEHDDVEREVNIYDDNRFEREKQRVVVAGIPQPPIGEPAISGVPRVKLSFLANNGTLPERSGLNWGQRPEYNREPNQAYIRMPARIYRTEFFPPIGEHFTVLTDDDQVLICTRAQAEGKAIECPHNNSLIGTYFRRRLGLPDGQAVTKADLVRYGRTDVDFYKLDDETYFMDFSQPIER